MCGCANGVAQKPHTTPQIAVPVFLLLRWLVGCWLLFVVWRSKAAMLGDEGGLLDAPNVQVILVATNNTYKPIFYHCNDVAKAKLKESAARYDVSAKHLILTCSCSHHTHQLTHLHSLFYPLGLGCFCPKRNKRQRWPGNERKRLEKSRHSEKRGPWMK